MKRSWPSLLLAFATGVLVFFALRDLRVAGGDTEVILSRMWSNILWDSCFTYYVREPLAHMMAHATYLLTGDLTLAFSVVGAFCGGLYLALLAWYCPRPAFWLVNLFTVATWNFVGHIEFYAPIVVSLSLYFMLLARALEPVPRARPIHVVAAFCLAFLFHKGALFFAPAMIWLLVMRRDGRWVRRPWVRPNWEGAMLCIILMGALDVLPGLIYNYNILPVHCMYVALNERLVDLVTPLTPAMARAFEKQSITGMFYVYTFGTPKHWAYFFSFLVAGAPLGLGILLARWRQVRSDSALALATAAACGILWIFLWQPRAFWKDWDLFCLATLPVNLLAGGLLAGLYGARPAAPEADQQAVPEAGRE